MVRPVYLKSLDRVTNQAFLLYHKDAGVRLEVNPSRAFYRLKLGQMSRNVAFVTVPPVPER
jgi:hypothetical protein